MHFSSTAWFSYSVLASNLNSNFLSAMNLYIFKWNYKDLLITVNLEFNHVFTKRSHGNWGGVGHCHLAEDAFGQLNVRDFVIGVQELLKASFLYYGLLAPIANTLHHLIFIIIRFRFVSGHLKHLSDSWLIFVGKDRKLVSLEIGTWHLKNLRTTLYR